MNQMQENQMQESSQESSEVKDTPETKDSAEVNQAAAAPPPVPAHPLFSKPQRVAFVQSAWHREVIERCRLAFLAEI